MPRVPATLPASRLRRPGRALAGGLAAVIVLGVLALLTLGGWLALHARPSLHAGDGAPWALARGGERLSPLPTVLTATPTPLPAARPFEAVLVGSAKQAAVLQAANAALARLAPGLPLAPDLLLAPLPANTDDRPTRTALDELANLRQQFGLPTTIVDARPAPEPTP